MPVLKIKTASGTWQEVWGALSSGSASAAKMTTITLLADSWIGNSEPYWQSVEIAAATVNSKIDLQPTADQIISLQSSETSLMVQNNGNGTFTAYAIGNKPEVDYEIQILISEVVYV